MLRKKAQEIVNDEQGFMLIQGEEISQSYWDSVSEEINERLQECSQIALAELAAHLQVGSELIASVLEPRLGTLVKGRLEGGQLYTPAYVARLSAMVRGAARGITVPTNLSMLWSSLQQLLQEMDGASGVAVDASFFQSLFNGLLKEGVIIGSLRAGVYWTPTVFAHPQKDRVDSFNSQNSFISYEVLRKLSIPQPIQFLKSSKALIFGESYLFSDDFIKDRLEKEMEAWSVSGFSGAMPSGGLQETKVVHDLSGSTEPKEVVNESDNNEQSIEKGSKKKRSKPSGSTVSSATEVVHDIQENIPTKSKKGQRKGKGTSSSQVSDPKTTVKKESVKIKDVNPNIPAEEWIMQKISVLAPDFEVQDVHNKLKNGVQVEEPQDSISVSLSSGERTSIAKSFPGSLLNKVLAVNESMEGKPICLNVCITEGRNIHGCSKRIGRSGVLLKKLDKKLERMLLHFYRKDLTSQASAETDPVSLLPKVISLLYIQLHHKSLQAPGRAISVAITWLKDKLEDSAYNILTDYQAATVTLWTLLSAKRVMKTTLRLIKFLAKEKILENQMPVLKSLVSGIPQS